MPNTPDALLCGRIDGRVSCLASCWRWRNFDEECPKEEPMHHPSCPRRRKASAECIGCGAR